MKKADVPALPDEVEMKHHKILILPSIADVLFIALFMYMAFSSGGKLLNDGDTGYHIRAGEFILNNFSIPTCDSFSFISPALDWTAHEWLAEVIMAAVHRYSGMTGLVLFFIFLISFSYSLLFKTIRYRSEHIVVSIAIVLLATASSQLHWLARPHVFSFVLMILWYDIIDSFQYKNRNMLLFLPFIMLLWVNLHGGFMGGFILLGVYLAGNILTYFFCNGGKGGVTGYRIRAYSLTICACVVASLINPQGFHILTFPFALTGNHYLMDNVGEFVSPNFHANYVKPFALLLLFTFSVMALSKNKPNVIEVLLVLVFTYMSLYSVRYIPLFAIIAAPILLRQVQNILDSSAGTIAEFLKKRSRIISPIDHRAAGFVWPAATVLVVVVLAGNGDLHYSFDQKMKPVAAVEFLKKEIIQGNMFNNDEFGDYIIYSAYPMYKVFIDGRLDMYGTGNLKEYKRVSTFEPGWEKVLDKYSISWIIYNANSPLSRFLYRHGDWKLIYADEVTNIFVKNTMENQHLIRKYQYVRPVFKEEHETSKKVSDC